MKSFAEYRILVSEVIDGRLWLPGYKDAEDYKQQLGREEQAALRALGRAAATVAAKGKSAEALIEETRKPPAWQFWSNRELERWAAARALGEKGRGYPSARDCLVALLEESSDDLVCAAAESLPRITVDDSANNDVGAIVSALMSKLTSSACSHVQAACVCRAVGILGSAARSAERTVREYREPVSRQFVDGNDHGPRAEFDAQRLLIWADCALEGIGANPVIPIFKWVDPKGPYPYQPSRVRSFDEAAHEAGFFAEALEAASLLGPPSAEMLAAVTALRTYVTNLDPAAFPPRLVQLVSDALSSFEQSIGEYE